jgi:uncharacterized protein (DUF433 family)
MQPYTYYDSAGVAEVIVNVVPAPGSGRVWARGRYSENVRPSALSLRIGRGIELWKVIGELHRLNDSVDRVVALYDPHITRSDVEAAMAYYERDPEEIDRQLSADLAEV